jgi:cohesin loading factor subunit SCC2
VTCTDLVTQSARELTAAVLAQELAVALRQVNQWISGPNETALDRRGLVSFGSKIKLALRDVWKEHVPDVFDIGFELVQCSARYSPEKYIQLSRRSHTR